MKPSLIKDREHTHCMDNIHVSQNGVPPTTTQFHCLLSHACKILEHIICSIIAKYLETHDILNDVQHGKNRSCKSQLILTIQDLAKGIDLGEQTFRKRLTRFHTRDYSTKLGTMASTGRLFSVLGTF